MQKMFIVNVSAIIFYFITLKGFIEFLFIQFWLRGPWCLLEMNFFFFLYFQSCTCRIVQEVLFVHTYDDDDDDVNHSDISDTSHIHLYLCNPTSWDGLSQYFSHPQVQSADCSGNIWTFYGLPNVLRGWSCFPAQHSYLWHIHYTFNLYVNSFILSFFSAVSAATNVEKNKLDFKDKAVRSAAAWNSTFNRSRRDQRRCCFDLQSFTIHYPRNRFAKNLTKEPTKPGPYPLSLIPGQYTDFYKRWG